jgi:hypothetical protein
MDFNTLKGRIGEAFVERILYDAGYTVCRSGRESQAQRLFMTGEGEFLPDFFVWRSAEPASDGTPLHRLLSVEVKFRSNLQAFLRPSEVEPLLASAVHWPELYFVLVTDNPAPGRSCFQLLDLREADPDIPLAPVDLHQVHFLGVTKTLTDQFEQLLRQVFAPLQENKRLRKPPLGLPGRTGHPTEKLTRPRAQSDNPTSCSLFAL